MTYQPYSIRFKPDERAALKELSRRLNRSQQDTVRVLVKVTLETLRERERSVKETQHKNVAV
jgi:hypothetical protein